MTAYDFSLVKNTAIAFNAATDSLNLGTTTAAALGVSTSGSNLVLRVGSDSVTLTGASVAQVTTSNITFGTATNKSVWFVGDNNSATTSDATGNVINLTADFTGYTAANQQHSNHLIHGQGGNDLITVGNGDNVIFGGTGGADSTDGNDTMTIGTGGNTVYGNAGGDTVNIGVTAAGKTNTVYLGLGDDIVTVGAGGGNALFFGNTGNDTLTSTVLTGDATIYGGNGIADSTDGNDVINFGTGGNTVYGNAGTDSITGAATQANKTATVFAGSGNDTITGGAGLAASNTVFYGNTGNDIINNAANLLGNTTIFGGNGIADSTDGNDTITLGVENTTVYANSGDDSITLNANMDNTAGSFAVATVYAGTGNDTFTLGVDGGTAFGARAVLYGAAGNDTYTLTLTDDIDVLIGDFASGDIVNATFTGATAASMLVTNMGTAPEVLFDGAGANGIFSAATDERIVFSGYSGDFTGTNLNLGAGKGDIITNFTGTAATLTGSAGEGDHLISGSSADTLNAGETATGVVNKLIGNGGADTFQFTATVFQDLSATATTVTGGDGVDIIEITGATAVTAQDADFTATVTQVERLKLNNVTGQSVTIAAGAVTAGLTTVDASALTGANTSTIAATAFASALTVLGGTGVDAVTRAASAGSDNMSLGSGADTLGIDVAGLTSSDTLDGGADTDVMTFSTNGTVSDSQFTNVSTFDTLVLSGAGANNLTLGAEFTGGGFTTVTGGADADTINATSATVGLRITGAAGIDVITGGTGNDTIVGGAAADTISLAAGGADVVGYGTGDIAAADVVTGFEFNNGSGDRIAFAPAITQGATTPSATTYAEVEAAAAGLAAALLVAAVDEADNTFLFVKAAAGGALTTTQIETAIAGAANITGIGYVLAMLNGDAPTALTLYTDAALQTDAGGGAGLILIGTYTSTAAVTINTVSDATFTTLV